MKFLTVLTPLESEKQHIVHINMEHIALIEWYAERASRITLVSGMSLLVAGDHTHLLAIASGEVEQ